MVTVREKELRYGKMALNILVTGNKTRQMARADLYMLMAMCMKEIGITTKLRGEARMTIWTEPNMSVTGKKTGNMAMELKHGQIKLSMRAITNTGRSMVSVPLNGQMVHLTLVNSTITIFMEKECTLGQIIEGTRENGEPTRCTAKVPLPGSMAENT